jgi:hypothetical protein
LSPKNELADEGNSIDGSFRQQRAKHPSADALVRFLWPKGGTQGWRVVPKGGPQGWSPLVVPKGGPQGWSPRNKFDCWGGTFHSQRGFIIRFTVLSTVAILAQGTNLGCCGHASLLQNGWKASASMYFVIEYCKKSSTFDTAWPSAKPHQRRR